ncbi:MAG: hypothetical protein AB8G77_06290 [Rhodothermales bacterium]
MQKLATFSLTLFLLLAFIAKPSAAQVKNCFNLGMPPTLNFNLGMPPTLTQYKTDKVHVMTRPYLKDVITEIATDNGTLKDTNNPAVIMLCEFPYAVTFVPDPKGKSTQITVWQMDGDKFAKTIKQEGHTLKEGHTLTTEITVNKKNEIVATSKSEKN